MKDYKTEQLRNVVLLSHGSAGKTSFAEAMVFASGAISRMGRVESGNTVADFDEEEIERQISLSMAVVAIEWNGYKLNILDTPGTFDFVGEVKQAVCIADGALFLVDPVSGVEVGTELTWEYADDYNLPRMVVVNKMDRENASFDRALNSLNEQFDANFVPLLLPIGNQSDFKGVVDVVKMKAFLGEEGKAANIPDDMADQVEEARMQLVEAAAESNDELIMKYLDGEELSESEVIEGLKASVSAGTTVPVLCGAGVSGIGIRAVLDACVNYLPAPAAITVAVNPSTGEEEELEANLAAPLSALVFKSTVDPYGKLSYFRVYSGQLDSDSRVHNVDSREEERLGQLGIPRGKEQIPVAHVVAGDIGVVTKLSNTETGHTLCDKGHPLKLQGPRFPDPIYSVAVSPKTKADSAKMGTALSRLVEEDPTFEWHTVGSTRQTILSGMGDTHIAIGCQRLTRKFGVEVITSVPKVPYREAITRKAETT
ncbi:MAG: GTP-binding protein, partial [Anaerolineae bacterium]|nr:GTP-binding protein [Anaerolineae bacterium]